MVPAFCPPRSERWLLVMEGDCTPWRLGPFADDEALAAEARDYRARHGEGDGLYRLFVGDDGAPIVESFGFAELDPEVSP